MSLTQFQESIDKIFNSIYFTDNKNYRGPFNKSVWNYIEDNAISKNLIFAEHNKAYGTIFDPYALFRHRVNLDDDNKRCKILTSIINKLFDDQNYKINSLIDRIERLEEYDRTNYTKIKKVEDKITELETKIKQLEDYIIEQQKIIYYKTYINIDKKYGKLIKNIISKLNK